MKNKGPNILIYDIETSPIISHTWGLFDQNIGLNQVVEDWHILSFGAKWAGKKEFIYFDQSKEKDITNDKAMLDKIRELLDQADIVVYHNGRNFDERKLRARMAIQGIKPFKAARFIDTLQIARRLFGFTSNKLEYLADKLNRKYKKMKHARYPGHDLWKEILKGNKDAWKEMKVYNKYDVLALEELYPLLISWDSSITFQPFTEDNKRTCTCGSVHFKSHGFRYTKVGKYQAFQCKTCGKTWQDSKNLIKSKEVLR